MPFGHLDIVSKNEIMPLTWPEQTERLLGIVIQGDLLPLSCKLCLDDDHADRLIRIVADTDVATEGLHSIWSRLADFQMQKVQ